MKVDQPLDPDWQPQGRRSHARRKADELVRPSSDESPDAAERLKWIESVCEGFVSPSSANKQYYRVILETLWPAGRGIPGPHVSEDELREAVNRFRKENRVGRDPDRRYLDVFRRVRELQGEEGVVGAIKQGRNYQLVDLDLAPKRVPRTGLGDADWAKVLGRYDGACASCGRKPPDVVLEQDHKVPRLRGGGDEVENWQPLCTECNNHKSIRCRNCQLECRQCPWAFPEEIAPVRLSRGSMEALRQAADKLGADPSTLADEAIRGFLRRDG